MNDDISEWHTLAMPIDRHAHSIRYSTAFCMLGLASSLRLYCGRTPPPCTCELLRCAMRVRTPSVPVADDVTLQQRHGWGGGRCESAISLTN